MNTSEKHRKRKRTSEGQSVSKAPKLEHVATVIDDDKCTVLFVYELKCIMHPLSQQLVSNFDSVLLMSRFDLHKPFPFCPFHVGDMEGRSDAINQKSMFISATSLFNVDITRHQTETLLQWFKSILSSEQSEFNIVSQAVNQLQELNSELIMFPCRDVTELINLMSREKMASYGNYTFESLFQSLQNIILENVFMNYTCDGLTVAQMVQDQAKSMGVDTQFLAEYASSNRSQYRQLSLYFEDSVVVDTTSNKLYIIEYVDIHSESNVRLACSPVDDIKDISVLRASNLNHFDRFIDKQNSENHFVYVDAATAVNPAFSSSVLKILERGQFIQQFFQQLNHYFQMLTLLQEHLDIKFKDINLMRQSLTHDSFALFHGNRYIGNERLEYLGDAVLDVFSMQYCYHSDIEKPSEYRRLVTNKRLAEVGNSVQLKQLILSMLHHVSDKHVADSIEALTGAIFLDQGIEAAAKFCQNLVISTQSNIPPKQSLPQKNDPRLLAVEMKLGYTFKNIDLASRIFFDQVDPNVTLERQKLKDMGTTVIKLISVFHNYSTTQMTLSTIVPRSAVSLNFDAANAELSKLLQLPFQSKASFQIIVGLLFIEAGLHFLQGRMECDVVGDFVHKNYIWKDLGNLPATKGEKLNTSHPTRISDPQPAPPPPLVTVSTQLPEITSNLPIPYWLLQQHVQAREQLIFVEQQKQLQLIDRIQKQISSLQNTLSNNMKILTQLDQLEQAISQTDDVSLSTISTYAPSLLPFVDKPKPQTPSLRNGKTRKQKKGKQPAATPQHQSDTIIIDDD